MNKNYYVCNERRGNPVVAHETYEDAVKEARRLAEKEKCKFHVFLVVAEVVPEVIIKVKEFSSESIEKGE